MAQRCESGSLPSWQRQTGRADDLLRGRLTEQICTESTMGGAPFSGHAVRVIARMAPYPPREFLLSAGLNLN